MVSKTAVSGKAAIDSDQKRWKGVRKRAWGRWVCEIRLPRSRQRIWLGSYATAEEAACAYDAASLCLRGNTASLNFPTFSSISSVLSRSLMYSQPLQPLSREAIQSIAAAAAAQCRNPQAAAAAAANMAESRSHNLSAPNESQTPARIGSADDQALPCVRPADMVWAMALQLRLKMRERSAAMREDEPPQPKMNGVDAVQMKGETSSSAEEDQFLFLKEIEHLPIIADYPEP